MDAQTLLSEAKRRLAGDLCVLTGEGSGGGFVACSGATAAPNRLIDFFTGEGKVWQGLSADDKRRSGAMIDALEASLGRGSIFHPENRTERKIKAWVQPYSKESFRVSFDGASTEYVVSFADLKRFDEAATAEQVSLKDRLAPLVASITAVRDAIDTQPREIRDLTSDVRFYADRNADDPHYEKVLGLDGFRSAATANSNSGTIAFYGMLDRKPKASTDDLSDITIHEVGHLISLSGTESARGSRSVQFALLRHDQGVPDVDPEQVKAGVAARERFSAMQSRYADAFRVSQAEGWGERQRYRTESGEYADRSGSLTTYGSTNWQEDFAETFMLSQAKLPRSFSATHPLIAFRFLQPANNLESRLADAVMGGASKWSVPKHMHDRLRAMEELTGKPVVRASFLKRLKRLELNQVQPDEFPSLPSTGAIAEQTMLGSLLEEANLCLMRPELCYGAQRETRTNMPQIKDRVGFRVWLAARGVAVGAVQLAPAQVTAGQREIDPAKVASLMVRGDTSGVADLAQAPLISGDRKVVDGHHRWAAALTLRPLADMTFEQIKVSWERAIELADQYTNADPVAGVPLVDPKAADPRRAAGAPLL